VTYLQCLTGQYILYVINIFSAWYVGMNIFHDSGTRSGKNLKSTGTDNKEQERSLKFIC
jgi:hypothetical protein